MFWSGIVQEIALVVNDDGIGKALNGRDESSDSKGSLDWGIMQRMKDYDRDYRLKKHCSSKISRVVAAIYIFSNEMETHAHKILRRAVVEFAEREGSLDAIQVVDAKLKRIDGKLYWTG